MIILNDSSIFTTVDPKNQTSEQYIDRLEQVVNYWRDVNVHDSSAESKSHLEASRRELIPQRNRIERERAAAEKEDELNAVLDADQSPALEAESPFR